MKLTVRTLTIALLVAGLFASARTPQTSATATSHQVLSSMMPPPACPPDDPDGCGIGPKLQTR